MGWLNTVDAALPPLNSSEAYVRALFPLRRCCFRAVQPFSIKHIVHIDRIVQPIRPHLRHIERRGAPFRVHE